MIHKDRVKPGRLLIITFTNKAAKELKERLEKLLGPRVAKQVDVGTFHSICARVLRSVDFTGSGGAGEYNN